LLPSIERSYSAVNAYSKRRQQCRKGKRGIGLHPFRAGTSQSAFPLTNAPNGSQSQLNVQMLVRRLDQQKKEAN